MTESFYDLYCALVTENDVLKAETKKLKRTNRSLMSRIAYLEKNQDQIIETKVNEQIQKVTKVFEDKVLSLTNQVAHLKSVLNNDSTNAGISTAHTPITKNKHIPNSRIKTGKNKGGQHHHPKHKLQRFDDIEITQKIEHRIACCPICKSVMNDGEHITYKDEYDFKIMVQKIRHTFIETQCPQCGHKEKVSIPTHLKEENQYGKGVQSLALSLMNEGYVSMNRTKEMVAGLTNNEIQLSEGYIAKLQKRLANNIEPFISELKKEVIKLKIVHWDDTVILIVGNRACLRFYGNDSLALYTAHMQKNKEGLDEDKILVSLDEKTIVMHDHNKVNYNEEYEFINVECCVHLLRDLKKVVDNLGHQWAKDMIELLLSENHKRKNGEYIDPEYIEIVYDQYIAQGEYENIKDQNAYYSDTEKTLLKRLETYKENYLMWTLNTSIPFSNNVSERALRSSKTKMKVSGQFSNLNSAICFANIKSYLETGHRYGMNSIMLIKRALEGNVVTIDEMKKNNEED